MSLPSRILPLIAAASMSVGCAHYANVEQVDEACWSGGETFVSSQELTDGRYHVVVERKRQGDSHCSEHWEESLVYDRHGRLESRTLDWIRCGVVGQRWASVFDEDTQQWLVERSMDFDYDGSEDRFASYEVPIDAPHGAMLGDAASCSVMAYLPSETPPAFALAARMK